MPKKETKRPANHKTKVTETIVVRVPTIIKRAYESEAQADGVDTSELVRKSLVQGLKKRGYKFVPETLAASGL
jgi:hypothetical protein